MSSKRIAISAPHGLCPHSQVRACDRVAATAAQMLYDRLDNTKLLTADMYRQDMDLNRDVSLQTPYRVELRRLLQWADYVVDVHSFPPEHSDLECYLLAPATPVPNSNRRIYKALVACGVAVGVFQGSDENSIMEEAARLGKPCTLIEFNESLSVARLRTIVSCVNP